MKLKKWLSTWLAMALLICSMFPTGVFAAGEEPTSGQYVLMNIPYNDFYQAELANNAVKVDAFTSATLNKTRTSSLAAGSYHTDPKGTDISGITYPVKVGEGVDLSGYKEVKDTDSVTIKVTNRGQTSETTYEGKDSLFENENYAYYRLNETPAYYKELTVSDGKLSFGKAQGAVTELTGVTAKLSTQTGYGDYQLDLTTDKLDASVSVYAVVIYTKEGVDYGLRHMENIWQRTKLAWSTGFTESVHNCPVSAEHYKNMMGQTIQKATYYTTKGIFTIPLDDIYVPIKFGGSVKVADAASGTGSTTITTEGFPEGFDAEYSVKDITTSVAGQTLSYENAPVGQYTLTARDKSGKYADLTATFILSTTEIPVKYDSANNKLVAADNSASEDLTSYLKNITSVAVGEKSYNASGRGSVSIIKEDGSIDFDAGSNGAPVFENPGTYELKIASIGYPEFSITVQKPDNSSTAKPDDTSTTKPVDTSTAKPADTSTTKPVDTSTTKPADTSTTKPADTSTTKPADTSTSKPDSTTKKPGATITAKPVTKIYGGKAFSLKKPGASYQSSNKNVISINNAGKAAIKGVGKTVITVKTSTNTTKTTYIVKPGKMSKKAVKASNKTSKKITVNWTKKAGLGATYKKAYYQIQYSASSKFTKKATKTMTVKGSVSSKKTPVLKKGRTYYVRMRGYDKANRTAGAWSSPVKVKIKK